MVVRDPCHYLVGLNALLTATAVSSISNAQHLKCLVTVEKRHPAWSYEVAPFYAGAARLQEGRMVRYLDTKENYCLIDRSAQHLTIVGKVDYLPIRNLLRSFEYIERKWYNASGERVARLLRASPTLPEERPL
jgi:hypothetical protein